MTHTDQLASLRRDYAAAELDLQHTDPDPFAQFRAWFAEALAAEVGEPNGMSLATVDPAGRPSVRVVLLKGVDHGFVFYTNHLGRKGRELDGAGVAALCFWWEPLERQVRVEGTVERVSDDESDAYFATRPTLSQIGAWASVQSAEVADRAALEASFAAASERFAGLSVPRPPHWGGYRVVPTAFEFWQGRRSRLHDRIAYAAAPQGWTRRRLAP